MSIATALDQNHRQSWRKATLLSLLFDRSKTRTFEQPVEQQSEHRYPDTTKATEQLRKKEPVLQRSQFLSG